MSDYNLFWCDGRESYVLRDGACELGAVGDDTKFANFILYAVEDQKDLRRVRDCLREVRCVLADLTLMVGKEALEDV